MKKQNENGFSVIEMLILLALLSIIGFLGWYVWHVKSEANRTTTVSSKSQNTKSIVKSKPVPIKTYANDEYGFSFEYPATWRLQNELKDVGRGHLEGEINVISPHNTIVQFSPTLGGKGGDCVDDSTGTRTTRSCYTTTILSVEKLSSSSDSDPVYFYHASITEPSNDGGKTTYAISIGSGEYARDSVGSVLGMGGFGYSSISSVKVGYVSVYVKGADDSRNLSENFFETQEIKEATPVLKSFKLIK